MPIVLFRYRPQRWVMPAAPYVIVLLVLATLAVAPARKLAAEPRQAPDARGEIVALHAVRTGILQARTTKRESGPAQSAPAVTAATREPGMRSAVMPANAAGNAIDAVLGQLQTRDEALLREPLLGMRLAEITMLPRGDLRSVEALARWAAIFAARLDEVTLPVGTRANLAALLAVYEHDVLGMNDALLQTAPDAEARRAALAEQTAVANADGAH